jgi:hypothetical protein
MFTLHKKLFPEQETFFLYETGSSESDLMSLNIVIRCLPCTKSYFLSKRHFFCTKKDQVNPISWVLIKSLVVYLAQKVISWARDIFSAQNWILVRLVKTDSSLTAVRFAVTDPTEKKEIHFYELHLKQRLAQVISTNYSTSWNTQ